MKLCFTAFVVFFHSSTSAFSPSFIRTSLTSWNTRRYDYDTHSLQKSTITSLASSGDDDDWYAEYDPSKFEQTFKYDNEFDYETGGRGRRGGGDSRGRYGKRDGGYTRDTSRDVSNVDEVAVLDILNQRIQAKKVGDFDTADALRDTLLNDYAVGVNDRERTWRTGCSASGSGQRYGGGGRVSRGRGERGSGRGRERGERGGGSRRQPRDFGPLGHDYNLSEDAGANVSQLTEAEIHNMLAERLQAKMSRNFEVADSIQMNLVDAGVFVHDGMKEWRADGVPYGSLQNGRSGKPGKSRDNQAYTKSPYSSDAIGASESVIDALVQERLKFKMNRDFAKADAVREGLRTKFNVLIDDRLKQWSVGGDFGEEHNKQRELADVFANRGYIKSNSSLSLSAEDEDYIQEKVNERAQAKKDRDFDTADDIRQYLDESFDVSINDKLKLWSIGGAFEELGGASRQKPRGVYTRRGGGDLSDSDVSLIEAMLLERYTAKKERNFTLADEIRDDLMNKFNVKIDDRSFEWRVDVNEYVMVGSGNLSAEDIAYIQSKVEERYAFKCDRYYDEADSIRDELKENFGVVIDDRTKEWCVESNLELGDFENHNNDNHKKLEHEQEEGEVSTFDAESDQVSSHNLNGNDMDRIEKGDMSDEMDVDSLSKLTVPQLKEMLKKGGLPVSGKKADLIARLLTHN